MMSEPKSSRSEESLTVALGEYDIGWHDPALSLQRAGEMARQSRAVNADLLVLPEMCVTGFTMEAETYAEPEDGPSIKAMSRVAAENGLWIVGGASMRKDEGRYVNTALVFSPDGRLVASYDKQRLFGYAKETEVYSPGSGSCVVEIGGLTVGVFICFDLRFPELFRAVGRDVDAFVLIANWPTARQRHWEVLTQARAIENQCYMIAVNRIGEGGGLEYSGGSAIFDPWGERCDRPADNSSLRIGAVSPDVVSRARESFPLAASQAPTIRRAK
jgi:predicted amidohydrolase